MAKKFVKDVARAVDELVDRVTKLRIAEQCGSAYDNYEALVWFYRARNELHRLIPGCEELVVDLTEELKDFVEDNVDDLFDDWACEGLEPEDIYATEEVVEEYRKYLEEHSDE